MGSGGRGGGQDDGGLRQQDIDLVRRQQIEQDQHAADQRTQRSEDEQRSRAAERQRQNTGHSVVDELRGDEPLVGIGRNERPTLTYGMLQRAFGDAMARRILEDPFVLYILATSGLFLVSFLLLFQALRGPDIPARASATPTPHLSASPAVVGAASGRPTPLPSITINASAVARIEEIQRQEQGPDGTLLVIGGLFALGGAATAVRAAQARRAT